jgi:hypothetical protein
VSGHHIQVRDGSQREGERGREREGKREGGGIGMEEEREIAFC